MKYGLCIGLNYHNTPHELNGCINDANNVASFLVKNGFKVETLTDENNIVTVKDILYVLHSFIQMVNCDRQSSKVFIHYSGHGSYIRDLSGDEKDGRDEVLCGSDGYISDDVLYQYVSKFNNGTRVFCLFDCCHSGTMLDLAYKNYTIDNQTCTITNEICAISGCADNQTSSDLSFAKKESCGLLTMSFLDAFDLDINLMDFIHTLQIKTKAYGQRPELTHTFKQQYKLDHFF